jgi:hypothetical protein
MKNDSAVLRNQRMSPEAYAGFLKLWLRQGRDAGESAEVAEYLRWSNHREPLPEPLRRVVGAPADERAA